MQVTETKIPTRANDNWHYWKNNESIPLSITKYFDSDCYELNQKKPNDFGSYSVSTVAYFDKFEDAKQFIFNAYNLDSNNVISRTHNRL
jgi:hypothetical protein